MKATLLVGSRRPPAALLDALPAAGLDLPFTLELAEAAERLRAGGVGLVLADGPALRSPDFAAALRVAGSPPVVHLGTRVPEPGAVALAEDAAAEDVARVLGGLGEAWRAQRSALLAEVSAELLRTSGPLAPRMRGVAGRLAQALGVRRLAVYAAEAGPGQILPMLASVGDAGALPQEICIGAEDAGRVAASRKPQRLANDLLIPMAVGDRVRGLLWMDAPAPGPEETLARAAAGLLAVSLEGAGRGEGAVTLDGEQLMWVEKLASLGQLAAGIAHEINNPLFVISGNLELALRGTSGPTRSLLDKALNATERIRRIVFEMRQFYLPQSHSERVVPLDVNALIENAIDVISLQAPFKDVTFQQDLDVSIPPVPGDDNQLLQVLTHLFLNSAQAMPQGGVITVRTRSDNKRVSIQVLDTGVGIPKEHHKRVFDPFFTTKQDWLGTGLGLSVSHTIVRNHGGTIELQSAEGKGATFTVKLPAAAAAEPARPSSKGGTRVRRVLVADDEETVRDFLEYLLRDMGMQVDMATDGAQALKMLEKQSYGVVLMDHLMPGLSGQEIGREIVARYPQLPVVLVTGAVSVDPDELKKEGFFRVLSKPCKADDIIEAVKAAVEG